LAALSLPQTELALETARPCAGLDIRKVDVAKKVLATDELLVMAYPVRPGSSSGRCP
jgi:hypothetical protein